MSDFINGVWVTIIAGFLAAISVGIESESDCDPDLYQKMIKRSAILFVSIFILIIGIWIGGAI